MHSMGQNGECSRGKDPRMPDSVEICYIDGDSAVCDGDCGALGHPKVYMAIDHTGRVTCSYCGRVFLRDPDRAGQCHLLSPSEAAALTASARSTAQH
jgi:uncharacterized Zn-finger protein